MKNLYITLGSPDAGPELKKIAIGRIFQVADSICDQNCDSVLEYYRILNDHIQAPEFAKMVENHLTSKDETGKPTTAPPFDVKMVQSGMRKFGQYLSEGSGQRLTARVKATIEFTRHLVTLNDEMIIALSNTSSKSLIEQYHDPNSNFQIYINRVMQQGRALVLLLEVALRFSQDSEHKLDASDTKKIATAINDLGFFYAKFVQSLSNFVKGVKTDNDIMKHFQKFQDNLDPVPFAQIRAIIKSESGRYPEEIFEIKEYDKKTGLWSGNPQPLATATIGQTYRWRLKTLLRGERDVIVKVQRPGRAEELAENAKNNALLLKFKDIIVAGEPFAPIVDLVFELLVGFEKSVERELDFNYEAQNLLKARSFLASQPNLLIPDPILHLTSKKMLVMEVIPGTNIEKMITGKAEGFEPGVAEEVTVALLDTVLFQFLSIWHFHGIGWIHGDMHPGNVFSTPDGKIGLLDWANEFETQGLIWQPISMALSFFLGNDAGFVSSLAQLARADSKFDRNGFQKRVREEMDKLQLFPLKPSISFKKENTASPFSLIQKRLGRLEESDQHGESTFVPELTKTFLSLLQEALFKYGWVPTDRYANLLRTSIPVIMTQIGLAQISDSERVISLLKDRWWRILLYQWPLRVIWGHLDYRFKQLHKPLVEFLESTTDTAAQKLADCAKSLNQKLYRTSGVTADFDPLSEKYRNNFTNK